VRILIVTSTFARFPGDPMAAHGNAMYDLVVELGRSVEGTLVTPAAVDAPAREQLGGIEVRRIGPMRPQASLANAIVSKEAPRVARVARSMRAHVRALAPSHDLAHAFWFFPGGWSIADLEMPKVMTVPGGIDTYPNNRFLGPRIRRIVQAMDVCVGVDTKGADILSRLGAASSKYVPSPIKLDLFPAAPSVAEPRLAFVGRLGKEKGVDVLLEALALAHQKRPDMTLEIVGDGPERSALEAQARGLGIADRVTFRGPRPQQEVAGVLQRARALVLPSRREGLPSAALEALATGRPIVASAVGGLPGLCDGGRGITVTPNDPRGLAAALLQACERDWDESVLVAAAADFAVERTATSYLDIYRFALATEKVGAR
jgi:glycosyltransferase involved in cell wall biosynthesis